MGDGKCFVQCRLLVNVDGGKKVNEIVSARPGAADRQTDKQQRAQRLKGRNVNGGKETERRGNTRCWWEFPRLAGNPTVEKE